MGKVFVVDCGSWNEKYAFNTRKEALDFWELIGKSQKVEGEYLNNEYVYVEQKSNKVCVTEGEFYIKETYNVLKQEEREREAKEKTE